MKTPRIAILSVLWPHSHIAVINGVFALSVLYAEIILAAQSVDGPPELKIRERIATVYAPGTLFTCLANERIVLPRNDRSGVNVFDVASGTIIASYRMSPLREVRRLGHSNQVVLLGHEIAIVDTERGDVRILTSQTRALSRGFGCVASNDAGTILAAGVLSGDDEGKIFVWDTETHKLLHTLGGHLEGVMSVAFSKNGRHVVSADFAGDVVLWDVQTGVCITKIRTGRGGHGTGLGNLVGTSEAAPCVRVSPSTANVAVLINAALDKSWIEFWKPAKEGVFAEWELAARLNPPSNEILAYDMEFTSDGRLLAVGAQVGHGIVFDTESGQAVAQFIHSNVGAKTQSLEFVPDATVLATGGSDGAIILWEMSGLTGSLPLSK